MRVVNPATGALVREVAEDDAGAVARKAGAARLAQPAWARIPLVERLEVIRRFAVLLAARRDELALLLTSETGKPVRQARNELDAMQGRLAYFLEQSPGVLGDEVVAAAADMEERLSYEPLGVIANISAWNYPWFVGSNVYVPALLAGNTVLYKPSEHAALTGLAAERLLHEAGVPPDAFIAVTGAGATGATLLEQDIDGVFFTGSWATGRRVAAAAGERMLYVQLELGGKDPAYVCDDADVAQAAAAVADGAFYNAGQSCCAVERIYVHRAVADAFVAAFTAAVRGFVVGDPMSDATYIGPLAREAQLVVLDEQVRDAVALGACVALGGTRRPGAGWYFEPTVLTGVDHRMRVMREESFGPVIGIQVVEDDAMACALMNDTDYGLTAAVYTASRARAERILAALDVGSAYWNCCDRVSPRLPWSGRRHSGLGVTLGVAGIRAFTRPKAYHLRSP